MASSFDGEALRYESMGSRVPRLRTRFDDNKAFGGNNDDDNVVGVLTLIAQCLWCSDTRSNDSLRTPAWCFRCSLAFEDQKHSEVQCCWYANNRSTVFLVFEQPRHHAAGVRILETLCFWCPNLAAGVTTTETPCFGCSNKTKKTCY